MVVNQLRAAAGRSVAAYPAPQGPAAYAAGSQYARRVSIPSSIHRAVFAPAPSHPFASSTCLSSVHRLVHSSSVSSRTLGSQSQTAKMSTMPATCGHNEACCNIPPVVWQGYSPKGAYDEVDGLKTYVTGPEDATKGIVLIYDIFGYFDQTVQGADILATSHAQKYRVFIPDWFKGEPCPIEWYPPNTPEKQRDLTAFFQKNPPQGVAAKLPEFVKALEAKYPNIKSWGVLGFCWGGKVVSLVTSGDANPFKVGAQCHPAMVDPSEAKTIKVPLVLLASKEEPDDKVKEFEDNLKVAAKHVETFKDQIHGWMAARADLSDPRVREEYARGYRVVLDFFAKNWE